MSKELNNENGELTVTAFKNVYDVRNPIHAHISKILKRIKSGDSIKETIEKVQALIEPVMTVLLGLILGWIMLSVMGPIYDTISKMKT